MLAVGLGIASVRFDWLDLQRGDLRGMQFFVGRIALPVVIFKVIATTKLESVCWGAILACNGAKVITFIVTSLLFYISYKRDRLASHRLVSATLAGFTAVASNDLAFGLPVIQAIYGNSMTSYMGANILVWQIVEQPCIMILLEVFNTMKTSCEEVSYRRVVVHSLKAVASNALILSTIIGVLWQVFLSDTMVQDGDGAMHFPFPLDEFVDIMAVAFKPLFLFINGALLGTAGVTFWSALLSLMKSVVCAYVSYALAAPLLFNDAVHDSVKLSDFSFFYGLIPTGGAPLLLAFQMDPGIAPLIASATLLSTILSGILEMVTALSLETEATAVRYDFLHKEQGIVSVTSCVCGSVAFAILIFRLLSQQRTPMSLLLTMYAFSIVAYTGMTTVIHFTSADCETPLLLNTISFFQTLCTVIGVCIGIALVADAGAMWTARSWAVPAGIIASLAGSLVSPSTSHELCLSPTTKFCKVLQICLRCTLLILTVLPLFWRVRNSGPRRSSSTMLQENAEVEDSTVANPSGYAMLKRGKMGRVAVALLVLQVLRLTLEIVDLGIKVRRPRNDSLGFSPMLEVVDALELGQGSLLLALVALREFVQAFGTTILAVLRVCGQRLWVPETDEWPTGIRRDDSSLTRGSISCTSLVEDIGQ
eukprot:TRINITY_DN54560_c0_g1_i1.p1 TRINITY_DN54560_c0_g1~~TRINITY_DN54560_c0_g1_i1.p1  ORF type:complete len:688 (+),score=45.39 TRINITY_DN54560_c0_g1_i1:118-2064(+)